MKLTFIPDISKERRVKMQRYRGIAMGITVLIPIAVCANPTQDKQKGNQVASTFSTNTGSPVNPATTDPAYKIGPDDMLDVNVWKEQELTRTLQVRPDGKISMPLLNDVQAAGMTPTQLAASLTEKLKKYLNAPQVTVIVTQTNSQRVYVLGEVTRPGAYALSPGMTVLQAISSAGGLTQYANGKKIFVMRTENQRQSKYPFNYKDVLDGRKAEENVALKAGDTVVVP
jgi:polysaccharide export outer membrane protein